MYMVCNFIDKSISRSEKNFVGHETKQITKQTLKQTLNAPYTYSTQATLSIRHSGSRKFQYFFRKK